MKNKNYWIKHLGLEAHPEGGYFAETYRSEISSRFAGFSSERSLKTAIYFLIDRGAFSAFHRIKSDEMWHFYAGESLLVHMIDDKGNYRSQAVGRDVENGEKLQFVVPAGCWFASEVKGEGAYALVGCTVSPGFDFADFELAEPSLATRFPEHRDLLKRLIR